MNCILLSHNAFLMLINMLLHLHINTMLLPYLGCSIISYHLEKNNIKVCFSVHVLAL